MILSKLLGIADLAALLAITLVYFDFSPTKLAFYAACYLLIKGIIFRFDFNSWFDIAVGIYAFLLIFGVKLGVVYIISLIYLGQKGLMSLV